MVAKKKLPRNRKSKQWFKPMSSSSELLVFKCPHMTNIDVLKS